MPAPSLTLPRRHLLALGLGAAGPAAAEAPLRFGYFDTFVPLSGPGPQGSARGLLVQLVDLVSQTAGLRTSHRAYPWRRAQALVEQGALDGFCTASTTQRERYAAFGQETLFIVRYLAFHRRGDARLAGLQRVQDLRPLRLGAFRGSGYSESHLETDRLRYDTDIDSVLRRIALGDLDATVTAELPGWHAVQRLGLQAELTATPLAFLPVAPFRIGLRRSLPEHGVLLGRLDRAARDLQRQGSLDALAAAYRAPA